MLLRDFQRVVHGGTCALRTTSSLSLEVMFVISLSARIVHLPPFHLTEVQSPTCKAKTGSQVLIGEDT